MTQFNPILPQELNAPNLSPAEQQALLTTANAVGMGLGYATVSATYRKQTKTKARIAGEDYVAMPGVTMESQTGTMTVWRRVDNKANRRKGVVGQVYFKIKSVTRADGVESFGYTNVRPEGLTAFVVLGFKERDLEAEAAAKAEDEKRQALADEALAKREQEKRTLAAKNLFLSALASAAESLPEGERAEFIRNHLHQGKEG